MDKAAVNQSEIPRKKVEDSKTSDFCVLMMHFPVNHLIWMII